MLIKCMGGAVKYTKYARNRAVFPTRKVYTMTHVR